MQAVLHTSPFAGSWYPADPSALQELVSHAFERSVERTGAFLRPGAIGFVVPHAAPMYSGTVAAAAYRHLAAADPARVVLLGFSHRRRFSGMAIPDVEEFGTPLGPLRVDRRGAGELMHCAPFTVVPEYQVCDHSVEIQLPFIRSVLPAAEVLPLYVGRLTAQERTETAQVLGAMCDGRTVFIASSDLTHYGADFGYLPFPADDRAPERLQRLDGTVIDSASSLDHAIFLDELERTGSTACGRDPVALLLEILRARSDDEVFQETLDYQTSAEITGDVRHSVSYGALGYFPASSYALSAAGCLELSALSRAALAGESQTKNGDSELSQHGRAFVSLYSRCELRGCVGRFETPAPLSEIVPALAFDAGHADWRFDPIRRGEPVDIEIHVLTPRKRIVDPELVQLGEHGVYLEARGGRGLLLPGVAVTHRLDRTALLAALAEKANLKPDVYAGEQAKLYVFREQVIWDRHA